MDIEDDCSMLRRWLEIAAVDKSEVVDLVAARASSLVHLHFDGKRLEGDLEATSNALSFMRDHTRWRALLYELCAAHPNDRLLAVTVRRLAECPEFAAEVAAHPRLCALIGSASSLPTFVASIGAQLGGLLRGAAAAQPTLDGIAAAGEVQHFCSQLLLHAPALVGATSAALAAEPGRAHQAGTTHPHAALVEAARAAMGNTAASSHAGPSRRLEMLAAGAPRGSPLLRCLVSVLTAGAISSADVQILREECERGAEGLSALQSPAVLALLLRALFDPSGGAHSDSVARRARRPHSAK